MPVDPKVVVCNPIGGETSRKRPIPMRFGLFDKLEELSKSSGIKEPQELLKMLINRYKVNYLILDIDDAAEVYYVTIRIMGGVIDDEWRYFFRGLCADSPLYDQICNLEVPPQLVETLYNFPKGQQLFYDGYVIVDLRRNYDFNIRRSSFHILEPTRAIIDEVIKSANLSSAEKLEITTEFIKAYAYPLPTVAKEISLSHAEPFDKNRYFTTPYSKRPSLKLDAYVGHIEDIRSGFPKESLEKWTASKISKETEEHIDRMKGVSIIKYLKRRQLHSFGGIGILDYHVEIEKFVFEYKVQSDSDKIFGMCDSLHVSVLDRHDIFYGAYELDPNAPDGTEKFWFKIGNKEALDFFINAFSRLEVRSSYGYFKLTHYMYDVEEPVTVLYLEDLDVVYGPVKKVSSEEYVKADKKISTGRLKSETGDEMEVDKDIGVNLTSKVKEDIDVNLTGLKSDTGDEMEVDKEDIGVYLTGLKSEIEDEREVDKEDIGVNLIDNCIREVVDYLCKEVEDKADTASEICDCHPRPTFEHQVNGIMTEMLEEYQEFVEEHRDCEDILALISEIKPC